MTELEREDIEALNSALYQIPKTIEKCAERYEIVVERLQGRFAQRALVLRRSKEVVVEMIGELRRACASIRSRCCWTSDALVGSLVGSLVGAAFAASDNNLGAVIWEQAVG